jgi:catechol 2,3-dioxygenase-like lactoylglutathione lyase family enzyme
MEVKGMAHIILTASNFERSREFYRKLLPFLGLQPMIDSDEIFYCVGGRTAQSWTRRLTRLWRGIAVALKWY